MSHNKSSILIAFHVSTVECCLYILKPILISRATLSIHRLISDNIIEFIIKLIIILKQTFISSLSLSLSIEQAFRWGAKVTIRKSFNDKKKSVINLVSVFHAFKFSRAPSVKRKFELFRPHNNVSYVYMTLSFKFIHQKKINKFHMNVCMS